MGYRLLQPLRRQVVELKCLMLMRVELAQADDFEVGVRRWLVERADGMKETALVEFRFRRDECWEKAVGSPGQLSAVCVKNFARLWGSARPKMIALESKGYEVEYFHSLR